MDQDKTVPHPFEIESMQGQDFTDHPMAEWNERPYAWTKIPYSDQTGEEVHRMYLDSLKKMIGQTVLAVEELRSPHGYLIRVKTEPAYTTQEGIKKARWKWWEWLRKLHAGEVNSEYTYLHHYPDTK